jgi:hypothetical protein
VDEIVRVEPRGPLIVRVGGATDPAVDAAVPGVPVYGVTRHPMMWAFAFCGMSHIQTYPIAKNVILSRSIIVLALVGAALQDRKKAALYPDGWPGWLAGLATCRSRPSLPDVSGRTASGSTL